MARAAFTARGGTLFQTGLSALRRQSAGGCKRVAPLASRRTRPRTRQGLPRDPFDGCLFRRGIPQWGFYPFRTRRSTAAIDRPRWIHDDFYIRAGFSRDSYGGEGEPG